MSSTYESQVKTKNILIVEDEGDICLLLNIMLTDDSTKMDHVNSIQSAKEYLKNSQPDVIVLDNILPDGMGIDAITTFKEMCPSTKILMISGMGEAHRSVALANKADNYLAKPFNKKQMTEALAALLED